eukprot:11200114-Lingulodinium_polyedra.AAC.1
MELRTGAQKQRADALSDRQHGPRNAPAIARKTGNGQRAPQHDAPLPDVPARTQPLTKPIGPPEPAWAPIA